MAGPIVETQHGTMIEPRAYGRAERDVEVVGGGETAAWVKLPRGARVELAVHGEPTDDERRAALERFGEDLRGFAETVARRVELRLLDPEGRVAQRVWFRETLGPTPASGVRRVGWARFGSEGRSEVLLAGTFVLEARTAGGRVTRVPVELVDGETARAVVEW